MSQTLLTAEARSIPAGGEGRPNLVIHPDDYPATAAALSDIIMASGEVFNRGGPVQVVGGAGAVPSVQRLTVERVVLLAHKLARPVGLRSDGSTQARNLPDRVARLYLAGDHQGLPLLKGVTGAPLLSDDGGICAAAGYDPRTAMWCAAPDIPVPDRPTAE